MADLYAQVDVQELQRDAEDSLLHYGTKFYPDFIVNASGQTIATASGHRMLDWTSGKVSPLVTMQSLTLSIAGQMSCLVGHGNPEIVKTISDHAANLDHVFSGYVRYAEYF